MGENKKIKLSAAEKKRRSENMRLVGKKRAEEMKLKKEEEVALLKNNMPIKDKAFSDLYIWGDSKFQGNPGACYKEVFGIDSISEAGRHGRKLLTREHVIEYVDKQMIECDIIMKAEKLKNIQTLTKIRDEMATAEYINRFGETNGVAACRSVAIKASETINDMLGFEKPKEVNINHGAGDKGIIFNIIAPPPANNEDKIIDITHEELK